MANRVGDQKTMPDVPQMDFIDAVSEIWFQISYAAYHLAYVRVYSQSKALQVQPAAMHQQEADVREHGQADLVICRAHLAAFFWNLDHLFEALHIAIKRGRREFPDVQYLKDYEKHFRYIRQHEIRREIKDYRNMSHQNPAIIGARWDEKDGHFLHLFLPTIAGHEPKEKTDLNQLLQQYFEFAANVWLDFAPGQLKERFPRDFKFPVTVPFLYTGKLPKELSRVPQLEVLIQSYRNEEALSTKIAAQIE